MGMLNSGRDALAGLFVGIGTAFNNANAFIAVGDSSAAFVVTQTDLQATTNKTRLPMDAGFPTRATNALQFKSTVGPDSANHSWQEWGIANAATGGTLFNRETKNNGTKVQGQTWVFTANVTLILT